MAAVQCIPIEEQPAAPASMPPLRVLSGPLGATRLPESVYQRRRLVVTAAVAAALTVLLAVGRPAGVPLDEVDPWSSPRVARTEADPSGAYVVEPGDTLWDIARSTAPGRDPRAVVHELAQSVDAGVLVPGQRLVIGGGA